MAVSARRAMPSPVVHVPVKRVRVAPLAPAEGSSFEYAFGQTELSEGWLERRKGLKDMIAAMLVGVRPGGSMDAAEWQAIGRAVGAAIDRVMTGGAGGGGGEVGGGRSMGIKSRQRKRGQKGQGARGRSKVVLYCSLLLQ